MGLKEILKNDFCKCTSLKTNICHTCKRKVAFINTPYGSIPTLELMNRFYEDYENEIKSKFKDVGKDVKNIIDKELKNEKNKLSNVINDYAQKVTEFNDEINTKNNDFKVKIQEIYDDFESKQNDLLNIVTDKQKNLNFLINQTYSTVENTLIFLSEMIRSIFIINQEMQREKDNYIDTIFPQVKNLIVFLRGLEKIIPQIDLYTNNIRTSSVEEFYAKNKQLISGIKLKKKKQEFEKILMRLPLQSKEIE